MDLGIKGKVALVAASSKGIGKAIAFALADEERKSLHIFALRRRDRAYGFQDKNPFWSGCSGFCDRRDEQRTA